MENSLKYPIKFAVLELKEKGKWQKWITKQELQIAKFKGYKILGVKE